MFRHNIWMHLHFGICLYEFVLRGQQSCPLPFKWFIYLSRVENLFTKNITMKTNREAAHRPASKRTDNIRSRPLSLSLRRRLQWTHTHSTETRRNIFKITISLRRLLYFIRKYARSANNEEYAFSVGAAIATYVCCMVLRHLGVGSCATEHSAPIYVTAVILVFGIFGSRVKHTEPLACTTHSERLYTLPSLPFARVWQKICVVDRYTYVHEFPQVALDAKQVCAHRTCRCRENRRD